MSIDLSPSPALLVYRTGTPFVSLVLASATGNQLIIGGVSYGTWIQNSFKITKNLGSTYTASVSMRYRGGSKPQCKQSVGMFWDSVKRFGGYVLSVEAEAIPGDPFESRLTVNFTGFGSLLDRLIVAKSYADSTPAETIVYELWSEHLASQGITYSRVTGPVDPVQPIVFHYRTLREAYSLVLDQAPGWSIWITDNGELKFAETDGAGEAAPFVLDRTGVNPALWNPNESADSIALTVSDEMFRNREWVIPSSDLAQLTTDTFVIAVEQTLVYTRSSLTIPPIITRNGTEESCSASGSWANGWDGSYWYIVPGTNAVSRFDFAPPMSPGDIVTVTYSANPFQSAFFAEDADSIAAVGLYEHVTQGKDITDRATAEALAQSLLDLYGPDGESPQSIRYAYNSAQQAAWLYPGMLQTVDWTFPDISGDYTVEQVSSEEAGLALWRHEVTLGKGPGDVTGVSDLRALMQGLRVSNFKLPTRATLEIASGVDLTTIPADTPNTFRFDGSGIIASWDARMFADPPAGADVIVDLLKNGVSIFPSESPVTYVSKIHIPAGSSAEQSGFRFVSENLPYADGDILTAVIIQVGSSTPGKNLLIHLNLKPSLAVAA